MHHGQLPRKATFGDIVTVLGYGDALYKVENFTEQTINEPNGKVSEVFYDLTDVADYTNYVIADDEDITVVATADKADEYFAQNPPTDYVKSEVTKVTKKTEVKTKQAVIDGLLDELNQTMYLIEVFREADDEYKGKIHEIKRKLKDVRK